jgi:hypothetical protein
MIFSYPGRTSCIGLWERRPAAIIKFRGWTPLPQGFLMVTLTFKDKHLGIFIFRNENRLSGRGIWEGSTEME